MNALSGEPEAAAESLPARRYVPDVTGHLRWGWLPADPSKISNAEITPGFWKIQRALP
jgi:hypothetical protein